jgi:triosephosphate isomerase
MKHRRPLIAGNWKMNGSLATNATLLSELHSGIVDIGQLQSDVAICVPATYLGQVQTALQNSAIKWGAQDVSNHLSGAYTGEVSSSMLNDFSCFYTIVGHSERRQYHAESDELVAAKTLRLLEAGIVPIVCVGETLQERKAGNTEQVVSRQLTAVLKMVDKNVLSKIVVAYEPVWAIGTGITATPDMAQQVHAFLRSQVALFDEEVAQRVQILYGGSMKSDNAASLLAMKDIDGGLIGGASLKSVDFLGIIVAANK